MQENAWRRKEVSSNYFVKFRPNSNLQRLRSTNKGIDFLFV